MLWARVPVCFGLVYNPESLISVLALLCVMLHRMHTLDSAPSLSIQSLFLQISRASSLKHLNIGGTFITDESLFTIAKSCPQLKVSLTSATGVHKMTLLWPCLPYACTVYVFGHFSIIDSSYDQRILVLCFSDDRPLELPPRDSERTPCPRE